MFGKVLIKCCHMVGFAARITIIEATRTTIKDTRTSSRTIICFLLSANMQGTPFGLGRGCIRFNPLISFLCREVYLFEREACGVFFSNFWMWMP
jgi:hypothetical protein